MQYSYSSWYPRYSEFAFESRVIKLPEHFIEFLHEEGISVCSSSKALPQRAKPTDIIVEGVDYDPDDTYSSSTAPDTASDSASDTHDTDAQRAWHERFPALHAAIESAIQQLGGQVAPKLNWSSPTDALWMSTFNSLKCSNADQVILLLKGSDRIMHDLEQLQQLQSAQDKTERPEQLEGAQPMDLGVTSDSQQESQQQQQQPEQQQSHQQQQRLAPELVLRCWNELQPEREFRCFVHQHSLVGISQRDPSQRFPQLAAARELDSTKAKLLNFHNQIGNRFASDSYAMDVYVAADGSVKVIDFNPISSTTSPLLYTWEELPYSHMHSQQRKQNSSSSHQPAPHPGQEQLPAHECGPGSSAAQQQLAVELRVVQHAGMILPGVRAATGMPYDMLGLQDSFEDMMRLMQQQQH